MNLTSTDIAVITGGPGTGKTTLCERLSLDGIAIGSESGRTVLAQSGGHDLRRRDPLSYSLEILKLDLWKFNKAKSSNENWLFDRGFPDNAGFLDLMGLPRPDELDQACRSLRYSGPVFVAPPWKEIYHGDPDRIQNWAKAKATHNAVTSAWTEFGYDLVELPKASIDERMSFVRQRLA